MEAPASLMNNVFGTVESNLQVDHSLKFILEKFVLGADSIAFAGIGA